MARPVDSDTETHKYLIEVIRHTRSTQDLVNIIAANRTEIPWNHIPTGLRTLAYWQTELSRLGVHEQPNLRTTPQVQPHSSSYLTQQTPLASARYQSIAPAPPQSGPTLTPPTNTTGAPSSSGRKRGRPSNAERKERETAAAVEQRASDQRSQARPKKRLKQDPPFRAAQSPPRPSTTPSILSTTTSTTSPTTLSSAGPESASLGSFARGPSSLGLAISSAASQPIHRTSQQPPRQPGPNIFTSPSATAQSQYMLPAPRPTTLSNVRDAPFTLPGISSTTGPNPFFGTPSSYSQSYSQPATPSYTHPAPSQWPQPQPPTRYDGPPPRSNEPRRQNDDAMEH